MSSSDENTYDIVIVGGGTAGLVLASRISEDHQLHVVVLVAGEDQTADPRVLTPAMAPALWKTPSDWGLQTVPQVCFMPFLYTMTGKREARWNGAETSSRPPNIRPAWAAVRSISPRARC